MCKILKRSSILFFLLFSYSSLQCQSSNFNWAVQGGGVSNDQANDVVVDEQGNVYVTGRVLYESAFLDTTLSAAFSDIFIAKLNSDGIRQWVTLAGGSELDQGLGIALDNDRNIIVAGYFRGTAVFDDTTISSISREDVFIAKYDNNGQFMWVLQGSGTEDDRAYGIDVDNSNNIYVTGTFEIDLTFGGSVLNTGTSTEIFLVKVAHNGIPEWAIQSFDIGNDYDDEAFCVAVDPDGNAIVSGYFDETLGWGNSTLSSYDSSDDIFIAKINPSGNLIWLKGAGGENDDQCNGIAVDRDHNIYLTGEFSGTAVFGNDTLTNLPGGYDLFTAKYDSSGIPLWARKGGSNSSDNSRAIAVNGSAEVFITGGYNGEITFGDTTIAFSGYDDIFIVKYNTNGELDWIDRAGGIGIDEGLGIAVYSNEEVIIAGRFESTCGFGNYSLTAAALADLFIASVNTTFTTSVADTMHHPLEFYLSQNYPNPFNPSTKIIYTIPDVGDAHYRRVVLKVYDVLGDEIETLVNEIKTLGTYEVTWHPNNLPSGIYFYRLEAGSFSETKKMLLLR